MRATWNTVSPIDRLFEDVVESMLGAVTSPGTFEPAVGLRFGRAPDRPPETQARSERPRP
ncbi:MAG: hypothetical protein KIS78_01530 [Labilithrix sp.]|nr:hypothetical protein [Labilithrix sp.]